MSHYIYKLIQQGEHEKQDFKFCINDSRKIAVSLVAFANTNGGRLLIGVKDNGKIAGISSDEEFYMVESAANIYSKPTINFTTQQHQAEGRTVLEINVDPGIRRPYFAKDHNDKWLAYIRVNDENFLAHPIQIEAWKKQKRNNRMCFSDSDDERFLIDFLQKESTISFSEFMRITQISRKRAREILSNFLTINIIKIHTTAEKTFFTLNKDSDKHNLDISEINSI